MCYISRAAETETERVYERERGKTERQRAIASCWSVSQKRSAAQRVALFFLPWQHWQFRQKTMAKPSCKRKRKEKKMKKTIRDAIRKIWEILGANKEWVPVCVCECVLLLYFIEIDILGCECICASILLLLYLVVSSPSAPLPSALSVSLSLSRTLCVCVCPVACSVLLASYSFACNGKINIENGKWELQTMQAWEYEEAAVIKIQLVSRLKQTHR